MLSIQLVRRIILKSMRGCIYGRTLLHTVDVKLDSVEKLSSILSDNLC